MTTGGIQSAQITYKGLNKGPYPVVFDIRLHGRALSRSTRRRAQTTSYLSGAPRSRPWPAVFSPMISGRRWACARTTTATRPGYYATGPQFGATHGHRRSNSAPLAAPPIRCCRRPIIRFTSAAMSARCRSRRRSAAFARSPCPTVRGFARSHRDPQHRRVGHGREPGKRARRFLGSSWVGGYQNLFAQADYYHIDVDRSGLISQ